MSVPALRALPLALVLAESARRDQVRGFENPTDLALVEAWILARESGEGAYGFMIPGEILSLLHVASPLTSTRLVVGHGGFEGTTPGALSVRTAAYSGEINALFHVSG